VSVSDAAPASAVKVASQDVTKCDVVTTKDVKTASLDRTKLSLKLPPRPEDYDFYWYQDDDGTWRNEYDDQVNLDRDGPHIQCTKDWGHWGQCGHANTGARAYINHNPWHMPVFTQLKQYFNVHTRIFFQISTCVCL